MFFLGLIIGIILGGVLLAAFIIYRQMTIEGDRDWLFRIKNTKNKKD